MVSSFISLHLSMGLSLSHSNFAIIITLNMGVNDFAIVVGTWVEKETNQLSLIF